MTLAETLFLLQFVKIKHAMIDTGCKIIEIKCIGFNKEHNIARVEKQS